MKIDRVAEYRKLNQYIARVLAFEAAGGTSNPGADTRIRAEFGITRTRYEQMLAAMLTPGTDTLRQALEIDALSVHRILDSRRAAATARARLTIQEQQ